MPTKYQDTAYGLSQALLGVVPFPIIATRAPTVRDKGQLGQQWLNKTNGAYYILGSVAGGNAVWSSTANAAANFTTVGFVTVGNTLTVTAGGATITAGGLLITAGGQTITAGNLVLTGGSINAPAGDIACGGDVVVTGGVTIDAAVGAPTITSGAAAPVALQPAGSIYINSAGVGHADRLYICTGLAWEVFTSA